MITKYSCSPSCKGYNDAFYFVKVLMTFQTCLSTPVSFVGWGTTVERFTVIHGSDKPSFEV